MGRRETQADRGLRAVAAVGLDVAEREPTEPPSDGSYSRVALESDCYGRHMRTAEALASVRDSSAAAHRRLDGLVGIDGGVGRVGVLEDDMHKTAEILAGVEKRLEKFGVKIAIVWSVTAGIFGLIAAAVAKAVLGP